MGVDASALEITWTSIAVVGVGFALWLFGLIYRSWRAVVSWIAQGKAVSFGPRHKFVLGFLWGIGLLGMVWFGFLVLGINAMSTPSPPSIERAVASERVGWILVGVEIVLLFAQASLLYAWVAVGGPSLHVSPAPTAQKS